MKEAIGGNWLFNIVIFFVVLFTGYLCLSINHTKAFNVKDDIVKIIERENGFEDLSAVSSLHDKKIINDIVDSLQTFGYRNTSVCPVNESGTTWYGFDREGNRDHSNRNSAFCIRKIDVSKNRDDAPDTGYYQVVVFYQLDLPIFNSLFNFNIKGDTKLLYR
ncbi:MAG: hypothetical protein IJN03_00225 [Bacilli bacterium]|nr:hypothetical protein [Bacilli bacterium]